MNRLRFYGPLAVLGSIVVVLCIGAIAAYATSLPMRDYRADGHRTGHTSRVPHASSSPGALGGAAAEPPGVNIQPQELDKLSYLPLGLNGYCGPWCPEYRRFGFNATDPLIERYDVSLLHAGRYTQYAGFVTDPPRLGLEFAQMIRVYEGGYRTSATVIIDYATSHRGALWLIGNEPDCIWQDNVTPEQYAAIYHELYGIIKGADPGARVAIGGIVQPTPLRLRYLDQILQEYQALYGEKMPVDVWNVHAFILDEGPAGAGAGYPPGVDHPEDDARALDPQDHDNMTIFADQMLAFRQWMKDRGERNKPLIVSEYGILFYAEMGFDEPRVERFMTATFDYFLDATSASVGYPRDDNRLVQAWYWFSLDYELDWWGYTYYSHLFDPDTAQITALGIAYGNYTASLP